MSQSQNIQPELEKVNALIEEVFQLSNTYQSVFIQKLIFAFPHRVKEQLIPLCYSLGAEVKDVAKALGVDDSVISRHFPKGGQE